MSQDNLTHAIDTANLYAEIGRYEISRTPTNRAGAESSLQQAKAHLEWADQIIARRKKAAVRNAAEVRIR